jgi:hypothetical protein
VEVPFGIPQTSHQLALPQVGKLAPSLSFGRFGFGSPVPEMPVSFSDPYALLAAEDCIYPEPVTSLLPGKFSGLLPYAFKEQSPMLRLGYNGF